MPDASDVLAGADNTPPPPPPGPVNELGASLAAPPLPPGTPVNELGASLAPPPPPDATAPGTTPPSQDPEVVAGHAHQSELAKIIHAVGGLLGGDKTYSATMQPDGTMKIVPHDSTTGESWKRVAAAALGGAAQGLAVGQGPGGPARAVAAGYQAGNKMPQQQMDTLNEQVNTAQKRVQDSANNALVHQKAYMATLESQQLKTSIDKESGDLINAFRDDLASSPNAKDFGVIGSEKDLMDKVNQNPDFFKAHTNLTMKAVLVPKDGGGFELHAIATDPGDDDRPAPVGTKLFQIDVDPNTGKPKLTSQPVSQGQKYGKIRAANQAVITQFGTMMNAYTKANPPAKPAKQPTTIEGAIIARNLETDPDKKAAYDASIATMKDVEARRFRGAAAAAAGAGGVGAAPAQIRANGGSIDEALNAVPVSDRATVKAIGEGRAAPPSRFTKEGMRIMGLVNGAYPDYDQTQFKTYQDARTKFSTGTEGQGLNFILTARNHLDRMENNIPDNVTIPWGVGSLINNVKNAANRSTDPKLKAFEDDMNAVTGEVARAYSGKALTDEEHSRMLKLINESDSPAALRGAIDEFNTLLQGKVESYRAQWNSAMPRGVVSPQSLLEKAEARIGTPVTPTAPAATAAPAAAAAPGATGGGAATPPAGGYRLPPSVASDPSWAINSKTGEAQHWNGKAWVTAPVPPR